MSLLLLDAVAQTAVDTVYAAPARDALAVAVDVAVLLMALGVFLLALLAARVLSRVDRMVQSLRRRLGDRLGPVAERAGSISDNLEFITDAVRTDVERLNASIKSLSERLNLASDRMEERVEEFNALMEVVQTEAEEIFLDTAATVRGVREGARTMASGESRERLADRRREDEGTPGFVPGPHPEASGGEGGAGPGEEVEPGSDPRSPGGGGSESGSPPPTGPLPPSAGPS